MGVTSATVSVSAIAVEPTADDITNTLARESGSITRTARALGLSSRYALYRLMKKYGIAIPER